MTSLLQAVQSMRRCTVSTLISRPPAASPLPPLDVTAILPRPTIRSLHSSTSSNDLPFSNPGQAQPCKVLIDNEKIFENGCLDATFVVRPRRGSKRFVVSGANKPAVHVVNSHRRVVTARPELIKHKEPKIGLAEVLSRRISLQSSSIPNSSLVPHRRSLDCTNEGRFVPSKALHNRNNTLTVSGAQTHRQQPQQPSINPSSRPGFMQGLKYVVKPRNNILIGTYDTK